MLDLNLSTGFLPSGSGLSTSDLKLNFFLKKTSVLGVSNNALLLEESNTHVNLDLHVASSRTA